MSNKCENCIHYECCCDWVSSKDLKDLSNTGVNCATYKAKSLFVELPVKVGQTVYLPWSFDGAKSIAYLTVTHIVFDMKKSYVITDFSTDDVEYYEKYKGGKFELKDFDEIIFTNKAKAEEKLKKLEVEE